MLHFSYAQATKRFKGTNSVSVNIMELLVSVSRAPEEVPLDFINPFKSFLGEFYVLLNMIRDKVARIRASRPTRLRKRVFQEVSLVRILSMT